MQTSSNTQRLHSPGSRFGLGRMMGGGMGRAGGSPHRHFDNLSNTSSTIMMGFSAGGSLDAENISDAHYRNLVSDDSTLNTIILDYERKYQTEVSIRTHAQSIAQLSPDKKSRSEAARQLEFSNKRIEVLATELVKFLKKQKEIREVVGAVKERHREKEIERRFLEGRSQERESGDNERGSTKGVLRQTEQKETAGQTHDDEWLSEVLGAADAAAISHDKASHSSHQPSRKPMHARTGMTSSLSLSDTSSVSGSNLLAAGNPAQPPTPPPPLPSTVSSPSSSKSCLHERLAYLEQEAVTLRDMNQKKVERIEEISRDLKKTKQRLLDAMKIERAQLIAMNRWSGVAGTGPGQEMGRSAGIVGVVLGSMHLEYPSLQESVERLYTDPKISYLLSPNTTALPADISIPDPQDTSLPILDKALHFAEISLAHCLEVTTLAKQHALLLHKFFRSSPPSSPTDCRDAVRYEDMLWRLVLVVRIMMDERGRLARLMKGRGAASVVGSFGMADGAGHVDNKDDAPGAGESEGLRQREVNSKFVYLLQKAKRRRNPEIKSFDSSGCPDSNTQGEHEPRQRSLHGQAVTSIHYERLSVTTTTAPTTSHPDQAASAENLRQHLALSQANCAKLEGDLVNTRLELEDAVDVIASLKKEIEKLDGERNSLRTALVEEREAVMKTVRAEGEMLERLAKEDEEDQGEGASSMVTALEVHEKGGSSADGKNGLDVTLVPSVMSSSIGPSSRSLRSASHSSLPTLTPQNTAPTSAEDTAFAVTTLKRRVLALESAKLSESLQRTAYEQKYANLQKQLRKSHAEKMMMLNQLDESRKGLDAMKGRMIELRECVLGGKDEAEDTEEAGWRSVRGRKYSSLLVGIEERHAIAKGMSTTAALLRWRSGAVTSFTYHSGIAAISNLTQRLDEAYQYVLELQKSLHQGDDICRLSAIHDTFDFSRVKAHSDIPEPPNHTPAHDCGSQPAAQTSLVSPCSGASSNPYRATTLSLPASSIDSATSHLELSAVGRRQTRDVAVGTDEVVVRTREIAVGPNELPAIRKNASVGTEEALLERGDLAIGMGAMPSEGQGTTVGNDSGSYATHRGAAVGTDSVGPLMRHVEIGPDESLYHTENTAPQTGGPASDSRHTLNGYHERRQSADGEREEFPTSLRGPEIPVPCETDSAKLADHREMERGATGAAASVQAYDTQGFPIKPEQLGGPVLVSGASLSCPPQAAALLATLATQDASTSTDPVRTQDASTSTDPVRTQGASTSTDPVRTQDASTSTDPVRTHGVSIGTETVSTRDAATGVDRVTRLDAGVGPDGSFSHEQDTLSTAAREPRQSKECDDDPLSDGEFGVSRVQSIDVAVGPDEVMLEHGEKTMQGFAVAPNQVETADKQTITDSAGPSDPCPSIPWIPSPHTQLSTLESLQDRIADLERTERDLTTQLRSQSARHEEERVELRARLDSYRKLLRRSSSLFHNGSGGASAGELERFESEVERVVKWDKSVAMHVNGNKRDLIGDSEHGEDFREELERSKEALQALEKTIKDRDELIGLLRGEIARLSSKEEQVNSATDPALNPRTNGTSVGGQAPTKAGRLIQKATQLRSELERSKLRCEELERQFGVLRIRVKDYEVRSSDLEKQLDKSKEVIRLLKSKYERAQDMIDDLEEAKEDDQVLIKQLSDKLIELHDRFLKHNRVSQVNRDARDSEQSDEGIDRDEPNDEKNLRERIAFLEEEKAVLEQRLADLPSEQDWREAQKQQQELSSLRETLGKLQTIQSEAETSKRNAEERGMHVAKLETQVKELEAALVSSRGDEKLLLELTARNESLQSQLTASEERTGSLTERLENLQSLLQPHPPPLVHSLGDPPTEIEPTRRNRPKPDGPDTDVLSRKLEDAQNDPQNASTQTMPLRTDEPRLLASVDDLEGLESERDELLEELKSVDEMRSELCQARDEISRLRESARDVDEEMRALQKEALEEKAQLEKLIPVLEERDLEIMKNKADISRLNTQLKDIKERHGELKREMDENVAGSRSYLQSDQSDGIQCPIPLRTSEVPTMTTVKALNSRIADLEDQVQAIAYEKHAMECQRQELADQLQRKEDVICHWILRISASTTNRRKSLEKAYRRQSLQCEQRRRKSEHSRRSMDVMFPRKMDDNEEGSERKGSGSYLNPPEFKDSIGERFSVSSTPLVAGQESLLEAEGDELTVLRSQLEEQLHLNANLETELTDLASTHLQNRRVMDDMERVQASLMGENHEMIRKLAMLAQESDELTRHVATLMQDLKFRENELVELDERLLETERVVQVVESDNQRLRELVEQLQATPSSHEKDRDELPGSPDSAGVFRALVTVDGERVEFDKLSRDYDNALQEISRLQVLLQELQSELPLGGDAKVAELKQQLQYWRAEYEQAMAQIRELMGDPEQARDFYWQRLKSPVEVQGGTQVLGEAAEAQAGFMLMSPSETGLPPEQDSPQGGDGIDNGQRYHCRSHSAFATDSSEVKGLLNSSGHEHPGGHERDQDDLEAPNLGRANSL